MAPVRGSCVYAVAEDGPLCGLKVWRNHKGRLTCPLGHIRSEEDHAWIERFSVDQYVVTMEGSS